MNPRVLAAVIGVFVAAQAWAAAPPGGRLFVSEAELHQVEVYAPTGEMLRRIPTGVGPRGMAAYGGKLFVADYGVERAPGSSVSIADLQSLQAERTVLLCEACGPRALTFDERGVLWVSAEAPPCLIETPPPYDRAGRVFPLEEGAPAQVAVAAGGSFVAASLSGAARIRVLDGPERRAVSLEVGSAPERLAPRPGVAEVWSTTGPEGWLAVVRPPAPSGSRWDRRRSPAFPQDLAFTPDGGRLLVTAGRDRALVMLDPATGGEITRLPFGSPPKQVVVSPDGRGAAVFLPAEEQVAVVQLGDRSLTVLRTFPVPASVVELLWLP